ncbi:MAG: hypothetical protein H0V81_08895 [Solirubrobacterales bacterium]|nr:hypothetical protein [Solirubrobacterales bacterium]
MADQTPDPAEQQTAAEEAAAAQVPVAIVLRRRDATRVRAFLPSQHRTVLVPERQLSPL